MAQVAQGLGGALVDRRVEVSRIVASASPGLFGPALIDVDEDAPEIEEHEGHVLRP